MNRTIGFALALVGTAIPLAAQSSAAACGAADSTARQIIKTFDDGDLRVCMLAFEGDSALGDGPRVWMATASRVILETQRTNDLRRLSVSADSRVDWTMNGKPKNYDGPAASWRSAVVDLLAKANEAEDLRKQVSRLRLKIDSLPQLRERAGAEIAATERRDRELTGAIGSLRANDRSLRAQVSEMEQRIRALDAQAARERASAARATDAATRERMEAVARRTEMEQRRVEDQARRADRRLEELDADRRIALLEQELRALRPEHTLTLLRLHLGDLEGLSVPALERELADLDADNRLRLLDAEVSKALAHLRGLLAA